MVRVTRSMARLNRLAVGEIDSQVSKANLIPGSPRGRKSTRVEECPRTPETVNVRSVVVTPPPRSSSSRVGDEEEEGWPVGVGEVDDFDDADVTSRASAYRKKIEASAEKLRLQSEKGTKEEEDRKIMPAPAPPAKIMAVPASPSKHNSVPASPSKHTSVPASPSKHISVPASPSKHIPIPASPSRRIPVPVSPSKHLPVPASPSKHLPVPASPSKCIPVPAFPTKFMPVPASPSKFMSVPSSPSKFMPGVPASPSKIVSVLASPSKPTTVPVSPSKLMPAPAPLSKLMPAPPSTPRRRSARTTPRSKTPAKPKTPAGLTALRRGEDSEDDTSLTPRKDKSQRPNRTLDMTPTKKPRNRMCFGSPAKDRITVPPTVSRVYGLVQKATGSVGGNGSDGAIYGELTVGCMQKVVNVLKEHAGFDENSSFIDVGSGLGKPNFHVAQDPGCEISYGLELEEIRWQLSVVNHRRVLLDKGLEGVDVKKHNLFFSHGDILSAKTFDPFTHVYMFDIGFPPDTLHQIAKIFNASKARHLISYQKPYKVIEEYGFEVDKILQMPLSLTVSYEGHMMYLYRRKEVPAGLPTARITEVDPFFERGVRLCREGGDGSALAGYVEARFLEHTSGGVRTRRARKALLA